MSQKIKNIVLIMLDTLQFNYLGCYGNKQVKTPNLDRFANENVVFENAYSEGLPTVPVRRALMTGRFTLPFAGWQPLSVDDTTIADVLWGQQIQTALVYDTPPMRLPKYGYSRGFDYVKFCPGHELDHMAWANAPKDPTMKPENYTSASMVWNEQGELIDADSAALLHEIDCFIRFRQRWRSEADSNAAVVSAEATHWLTKGRDKTRPFFLWMDSFDPHEPWDPPSVWNKEPCPYDPEFQGNPIILAPWVPVEGRISERECEHIRALYMEKITMVDRWVGKVLDTLKQEGLWDETMVVIMSDHGNPMGNGEHGHGIMRKSRPWPYEELVHIPLLMHVPGVEGGKRISSFVQNVDVTATIYDALGQRTTVSAAPSGVEGGIRSYLPDDLQGQSLLPLMCGEVEKIRDYAIAGYYAMSWSIITEEYSYIHWLKKDVTSAEFDSLLISAHPDETPKMDDSLWTCTAGAKVEVPEADELYDRKTDPFQLHNIAAQHPEKAAELLQQLKLVIGELRTS